MMTEYHWIRNRTTGTLTIASSLLDRCVQRWVVMGQDGWWHRYEVEVDYEIIETIAEPPATKAHPLTVPDLRRGMRDMRNALRVLIPPATEDVRPPTVADPRVNVRREDWERLNRADQMLRLWRERYGV